MHVGDMLLWGLLATGLLTTVLRAGQALHLTRMDTALVLGTMVTGNRDRARSSALSSIFSTGGGSPRLHPLFHAFGMATWWLGALMGIAHGIHLVAVLPSLPGVHPRMASDVTGPSPTRMLEPPGFLALNYRLPDSPRRPSCPHRLWHRPRRVLPGITRADEASPIWVTLTSPHSLPAMRRSALRWVTWVKARGKFPRNAPS